MFQDGGLKDQGNTTDPVSGNDVPSGSLKEEVRDDIDAKLSPGEFVFPADVVRFIGLEKLMMIRDKAKKGLSRMEDMGQMGNSDEATIDDDVPFGMEDLIIVSGGPENEMSKGGVPSYSRGGQLIGDIGDGYQPPTRYHNPATGQELMVTKIAGKFFPPLPKGFVPKPTLAQANPTSGTRVGTTSVLADDQYDETTPGDPINTGINSDGTMTPQESGEMRGNAGTEKSMSEMSVAEQVAYGNFAIDNPGIAQFGANLGDFSERAMVDGFIGGSAPGPIGGAIARGVRSDEFQDMFNVSNPSFPDALPGSYAEATGIPNKVGTYSRDADVGKGTYAGRPGGKGTRDRDRAVDMALSNIGAVSPSVVNNARKAAEISQANRLGITAPDFAMNVSMDLMSAHAENVSRGNAAPGSRANSLGGSTTFSKPDVTDYSYTTNAYGEVVDNKTHKQEQAKISKDDKNREAQEQREKEKEAQEATTEAVKAGYDTKSEVDPGIDSPEKSETDETSSMDTPSGATGTGPDGNPTGTTDTSGGYEASVGGGMDAPGSGVGGGGQAEGQAAEEYDGGLIVRPKRKKQKKMKRGGLASRK